MKGDKVTRLELIVFRHICASVASMVYLSNG